MSGGNVEVHEANTLQEGWSIAMVEGVRRESKVSWFLSLQNSPTPFILHFLPKHNPNPDTTTA